MARRAAQLGLGRRVALLLVPWCGGVLIGCGGTLWVVVQIVRHAREEVSELGALTRWTAKTLFSFRSPSEQLALAVSELPEAQVHSMESLAKLLAVSGILLGLVAPWWIRRGPRPSRRRAKR